MRRSCSDDSWCLSLDVGLDGMCIWGSVMKERAKRATWSSLDGTGVLAGLLI